ncbi:hypothetical protein OJF2_41990 [Aquisphaera giovannonii]|uniref:DUF4935 domain-containing protein n=1 Tax=Aquisphaera giovannonii TaxID=406548 RepID=A0A5B9W600_9BACT|nr:hypothetical protein [Aquisphaera giovannonii]QEH35644.1 hypothetical protein OJF2_41990 [Aquisphaera giovannonii]
MIAIPEAAASIAEQPAPVIILDTCSLLDVFRWVDSEREPRASADEIRAASLLLRGAASSPVSFHLVVPELVEVEYGRKARNLEDSFQGWIRDHDKCGGWFAEAAPWIGIALQEPLRIEPLRISEKCHELADKLLEKAIVLSRDVACLNRAIGRLIGKSPPCHLRDEVKDAINLEQALELSRRLGLIGSSPGRVFISSNTRDFGDAKRRSRLHPDIERDFQEAGLEYFTSLAAALGSLQSRKGLQRSTESHAE